MNSILQIVPASFEAVNGVHDYAMLLEKKLLAQLKANAVSVRIDTVDAIAHERGGMIGLGNAVDILILHYVGYGFARNGAPFWLIRTVGQWKRNNPKIKIAVIFHELYCVAPAWRRSFYLSLMQKWCARKLVNSADFLITSNGDYADRLMCLSKAKRDVAVWPVFSNVGEPAQVPPFRLRLNQLVIFGGASTRARLYRDLSGFSSFVGQWKISSIVDIGPECLAVPSSVAGLHVNVCGVLPAEEIASIMNQSKFGALDYPEHLLGKSGVYRAYSAFGLVPILLGKYGKNRGEFIEGEDYVVWSECPESPDFESISGHVRSRYESTKSEEMAKSLAVMMEKWIENAE